MSPWIVIVALAWTVGSTAMLLVAVAANMRLEEDVQARLELKQTECRYWIKRYNEERLKAEAAQETIEAQRKRRPVIRIIRIPGAVIKRCGGGHD